MSARWGDVLASGRDALFVGREAEQRTFADFVDGSGPRVLHLCGPPGVGKSTLLSRCLQRAKERGRRVLHLDGRWLAPTPAAVRGALAEAGDLATLDLLAIDTFEHLAPLASWLRDVLLPDLPARVGVVTAGRAPLAADWHTDPGLGPLLRVVSLRNLPFEASLAYLEAAEVAPARRRRIAESTHGHPLSLALAAELGRDASAPAARSAATGSLRELLLGGASATQRRALLAGSLCQAITEPLLGRLLDDLDPGEVAALFDWLRQRPFVELAGRGLALHELAGDLLLAELRARTPEHYDLMVDRLIAHHLERLSQGPAVEESLSALFRALRAEPGAQAVRLGDAPTHYSDALGPEDHAAVIAAVERHEGAESARVAAYWLRHRPQGWLALRDVERRLGGFAFFLDARSTSAAEVAADPLLHAFVGALARRAPLREREGALLCRFWMSVADHQRSSAVQGTLFFQLTLRLALTPGVAVGASVHAHPRQWQARGDATHELLATTTVDGIEHGIFGHDWRREPPLQWLERMFSVLRHGPAAGIAAPPEPILLDRHEFERAVRRALRDLHRSDRLAQSPLCWSPLVLRRGGARDAADAVAALRRVLEDACRQLGESEGDRHHTRVLEHEFLLPPKKQSASAAALGLGYSTYRRDLAIALARVIDRLWQGEIGAGPGSGDPGAK